jgi:hypothetical protein
MNWRKGFFRIWLVVSLLWVILIGSIFYEDWPSLAEKNSYVINQNGNIKPVTYDTQKIADEALKRGLLIAVDNPEGFSVLVDAKLDRQTQTEAVKKVRTYHEAEYPKRVTVYLKDVVLAALSVPLVLLASGFTIGWIVRGFRLVSND